VKRREFITLLGGVGVASGWSFLASAQTARISRIGLADFASENDTDGVARLTAFRAAMDKFRWTLGRNLVIDYRWKIFNADSARRATTELLELGRDVILCAGTPAAVAFKDATRTVPIVFTSVSQPVEQGIVQSLAHPGGNLTGFTFLEPTLGAKWLDLLKSIVPGVSHVALMFNPASSPYSRLFYRTIETAASRFSIEPMLAPIHNLGEVEQLMVMLMDRPGGGLIVSPEGYNLANRKSIIELAARYRLPAVYGVVGAAFDGGLIHYSVDLVDQYRLAAGYVDKILRGSKAADLPVQQPTKFSMVVNLKTAKALGVTVPLTLQASADEVIE
jgi:putative tryptophan/tyrosine transport system substrate-binding protein